MWISKVKSGTKQTEYAIIITDRQAVIYAGKPVGKPTEHYQRGVQAGNYNWVI
jgi:hypothetical protein